MKSDISLYYFKVLGSTNDKAKEFIKKGESELVIIAEKQMKGKGRFGRRWNSQLGGLYMTLLLKEDDLDKVRYLTFMAALAVTKAIRKYGLKSKVKWPNDVLINDKKVCGILTETVSGKANYAMVGIGANINQKKFPGSLENIATSLKIESNKNYNIKNISKTIIIEFKKLHSYYDKNNLGKIIDVWKKYSHTLGKTIRVKTLSGTYKGKAIDIDENCNLILKSNNGGIKIIVEGDISVI